MGDHEEARQYQKTEARPRVWIASFDVNSAGRALYYPQSIFEAVQELEADPSVGLACPMIPGKAAKDIIYSEDISAIGLQYGVIATTTASLPDGALNAVLLACQKLGVLEAADEKTPGLFANVLWDQGNPNLCRVAAKFRKFRNRLAHPDSTSTIARNIEIPGIPVKYANLVRRLLEWQASPYLSTK
jgi:hypothetical protein